MLSTLRSAWVTGVGPILVLVSTCALAGEICELTVQEQVGAARQNEPIRMGVPLGKGAAKELAELAIADASGKPIPSQFREVMRWPDSCWS